MRSHAPRRSLAHRGLALAVLALFVTACAAQEAAPAVRTQAAATAAPTAAPTATAAATGAAAVNPANVMLQKVPNAPPRATASPRPPGVTAPPAPTPPPAKIVPIYAYWDTVTAGKGESKYNVDASVQCTKSSNFSRGMHIVWRVEFVDTATGKVLQATDIRTAALKIPNGGDDVNLRYGRHGATADAPWFWTAAWDVPPTWPLGVLNWSINVVTTAGKQATITDHMAISSGALDNHVTIIP